MPHLRNEWTRSPSILPPRKVTRKKKKKRERKKRVVCTEFCSRCKRQNFNSTSAGLFFKKIAISMCSIIFGCAIFFHGSTFADIASFKKVFVIDPWLVSTIPLPQNKTSVTAVHASARFGSGGVLQVLKWSEMKNCLLNGLPPSPLMTDECLEILVGSSCFTQPL